MTAFPSASHCEPRYDNLYQCANENKRTYVSPHNPPTCGLESVSLLLQGSRQDTKGTPRSLGVLFTEIKFLNRAFTVASHTLYNDTAGTITVTTAWPAHPRRDFLHTKTSTDRWAAATCLGLDGAVRTMDVARVAGRSSRKPGSIKRTKRPRQAYLQKKHPEPPWLLRINEQTLEFFTSSHDRLLYG